MLQDTASVPQELEARAEDQLNLAVARSYVLTTSGCTGQSLTPGPHPPPTLRAQANHGGGTREDEDSFGGGEMISASMSFCGPALTSTNQQLRCAAAE